MPSRFPDSSEGFDAVPGSLLPPDFIEISHRLTYLADRKLGYHRDERFVIFYYEPRGQEIIWQDGSSYGFGLGGWRFFTLYVEPLMRSYDVHIGDAEIAGRHVLVLDRLANHAYFAPRDSAERFLAHQAGQ